MAESVITPLRAVVPCPRCGQPSRRDAYPFCSPRCADVDLNAWLGGGYAIPGGDGVASHHAPDDETASDPLDKPTGHH